MHLAFPMWRTAIGAEGYKHMPAEIQNTDRRDTVLSVFIIDVCQGGGADYCSRSARKR